MAINTQNIRIDLNPGRVIPVAHIHQNDTNRQLTFELYNNGAAFTPPSGSTVKFAYKSPIVNGQYSVITGSSMVSGAISGNIVTVTLSSAYTKVSGVGLLTMIMTTSGNTLRPVNIKFVCHGSADGDDSVLGASDWPEGLYDYMDDWLAENEPTEIANLKSEINTLDEAVSLVKFEKTILNSYLTTQGYLIPNDSENIGVTYAINVGDFFGDKIIIKLSNNNRCRIGTVRLSIGKIQLLSEMYPVSNFQMEDDNEQFVLLDKTVFDNTSTLFIGTNFNDNSVANCEVYGLYNSSLELILRNQNISFKKYNNIIDAADHIVYDNPSGTMYAIDISNKIYEQFIIHIIGRNNRFRYGFVKVPYNFIEEGIIVGGYVNGNVNNKLIIDKNDYLNYQTLLLQTDYENPDEDYCNVSVMGISSSNLIEEIFNSTKESELALSNIKDTFHGSLIYNDYSLAGNISFEEIPTDCVVKSIGKNYINLSDVEPGSIDGNTGEDVYFEHNFRGKTYIPVEAGESYTLSVVPNGNFTGISYMRLSFYDEDYEHIERQQKSGSYLISSVFTAPTNAKYARFSINAVSAVGDADLYSCGLMLEHGNVATKYASYESDSVSIDNGVIDGSLKSFNDKTTVFVEDYETSIKVAMRINPIPLIKKYHENEDDFNPTETECRERFRVEMREKAKRIGMNDTIVGDGAGHPVNTTITALDAIKMLCHAMSYQEIANTWSYDTKIIRTKGVVNTISMDSTLFKDTYISELTDYYTVLGFKTGSGNTHNLVCACTSDDLEGKVLAGCICLSQVADDANINRPKAMKTLMDMGKALVANRSADVSSYVSAMTAMTATRFTVVLLPNCNTKLLQRYDFDGSYSMLYNHSSDTFISWSMIKLMCAMTALDFMDNLDEANTVVYSDLLIGTGAYGPLFQEGEIITNRDALSALLIPSCNQAAYFLERIIGKKILEKYGSNGFLPTT